VLAGLGHDCFRADFAEGKRATAGPWQWPLRGLLPNLSGLIRDHAAFFVSNPTLQLSAMPFAAT
jgi:hypothetical protein